MVKPITTPALPFSRSLPMKVVRGGFGNGRPHGTLYPRDVVHIGQVQNTRARGHQYRAFAKGKVFGDGLEVPPRFGVCSLPKTWRLT